jgi:hypothetical protein
MRASIGVKGSRDIVFRANTVVGNLPSNAFAMRLNRDGSNPVVSGLSFFNNVWSDPTGPMLEFGDTPPADVQNITLARNGYWNGGSALPNDAGDAINPGSDSDPLIGDPRLPLQTGLQTPHWIQAQSQFNGGFSTIREVFVALVESYGRPAADGSGINQANAANMPTDDILGQPRGATPDLGAVELEENLDRIFADGFEN